jgi:hypothetical protein
LLRPLTKPVGVDTGELQDMGVMGQLIEQGCRQAFAPEDLHPIGKAQIGGDDQG